MRKENTGGVQNMRDRTSWRMRHHPQVKRIASTTSARAQEEGEMRTVDDAVELVGVLVDVGQQDAAGLQHREELRLSWRSQR
jgi:hypothetical protein